MKLLTDDGRRTTTMPAYTISSPGAFGSGELKNWGGGGGGGGGARLSELFLQRI